MGVEDVMFRYVTLRSIAEGRCYLLVTTCTEKLLMKAKRIIMISTTLYSTYTKEMVKNYINYYY